MIKPADIYTENKSAELDEALTKEQQKLPKDEKERQEKEQITLAF